MELVHAIVGAAGKFQICRLAVRLAIPAGDNVSVFGPKAVWGQTSLIFEDLSLFSSGLELVG